MSVGTSIQLTDEELRWLNLVERLNFRVTHKINQSPPIRRFLTRLQASLSWRWVEFFTSRSVAAHGFERFQQLDPTRGVLVVVNHRTFYDQFVIAARLFKLYGAHHNIYFPVRANFFYDNPAGLLVNLLASQGVMYPPIVRDRGRRRWNEIATDIMVGLLKDKRNMIGFHPEGTRNQGTDPYNLLPGKPGCGELIYRANPNVIPVFLQGFPSSFWQIYRHNAAAKGPLVHMVMGEPLDFTAECQMERSRKTFLIISRRVMEGIKALARQEQHIRGRQNASIEISS